jgi:glycine oxidase
VRWREKVARGALAPYVQEVCADGLVVAGAARVDLRRFMASAARQWQSQGKWREAHVQEADFDDRGDGLWWNGERFDAAVWCTGAGRLAREALASVPCVAARGEILNITGTDLPMNAALNRGGHWLLGDPSGEARVGATFERGNEDTAHTAAARTTLLDAAQAMCPEKPLHVVGQVSGVRLTLPDRLPVADWHPKHPRIGICVGLGSKGALWAPWLARSWRAALKDGVGLPVLTALSRSALG